MQPSVQSQVICSQGQPASDERLPSLRLAARLVLAVLAIAPLSTALQDAPATPTAEQADALFEAQQWEQAAKAYEAVTSSEPENGAAWFRLGYSLHLLGEIERALPAHQKAVEYAPVPGARPAALYNVACAQARLGRIEEAFASLDAALAAGFADTDLLQSDPDLDALRDDPRLESLAQRASHHELDFWLGEWDVVGPKGGRLGSNRIEKVVHGHLILEHWTSANGKTGKSANYFDPVQRVWKQAWVGAGGDVIEMSGRFREGAMRLEGHQLKSDGTIERHRTTLTPLPDGRVHQFIEQSTDDGQTWYVWFEGYYVPRTGS
jgi:tetratricopeptide (TPR) repeat protein